MTIRRIVRICLLVTTLVCVAGSAAFSQTDYSPRVRSMGTGFAGIVDDPFTDAFLNPARVGDMPGRGAWFGRLPSRLLHSVFPRERREYYSAVGIFPPEGHPADFDWPLRDSFSPYSIGLVTPVSQDLKLSIAGEISVDGSNDLEERSDVGFRYPPSVSDLTGEQDITGSDRGIYHGVLDAALGSGAPGSDGLRWGVRAAIRYNRTRSYSLRTSSTVRAQVGSEDVTLNYDYDRGQAEFERMTASLSFGVFRGTGFFAQAVAGVDLGRDLYDKDSYIMREDDEDYDGDGSGPGDGTSPLYRLRQVGNESNREYETGRVFGRVGLRWGRRVSSWHRLSYNSARGDGAGAYEFNDVIIDVVNESLEQELSYGLDGENSGYSFGNSVGFADQVLDNVLFACAVEAVIQREVFEEDGSGSGQIQATDNGSSSQFEGPYTQRAMYEGDFWYLSIPVAFEWEINEYAAWRFGVDFRASRTDITADISQDTETMGFPDPGFLPVTNSADDLRYLTATYFSSGVTLSFRDRIKLELLSGPTSSSMSVVYFSSAILEFRF